MIFAERIGFWNVTALWRLGITKESKRLSSDIRQDDLSNLHIFNLQVTFLVRVVPCCCSLAFTRKHRKHELRRTLTILLRNFTLNPNTVPSLWGISQLEQGNSTFYSPWQTNDNNYVHLRGSQRKLLTITLTCTMSNL